MSDTPRTENYAELNDRASVSDWANFARTLERELADARAKLKESEQREQELQRALAFWHPGVAIGLIEEADGRAAHDAFLLTGFEGPSEPSADDMGWIAWQPKAMRGTPREGIAMLTDERIIEIRDALLPSQGESFDCLAFARAIEAECGKWRPIAEAPKDEPILLCGGGHDYPYTGQWSARCQHWLSYPGAYGRNPTHWMPLPPAPPAAKEPR